MNKDEFPFDSYGVYPFHVEFAKSREKSLRKAFNASGIKGFFFPQEMKCGRDGKTLRQVINCDLMYEQYAALEKAGFKPIPGTRHTSATSSIPLPPKKAPPRSAIYTLQDDVAVHPPLRFKPPENN